MSERQAIRLDGPVRITMPAAVAYDLDALKKSITTIVERVGCRACFSGADCTFQLERDLVINDRLEVSPAAWRGSTDPDGDPVKPAVYVNLANEVSYNLDRVLGAVERIVDKLGHTQCFSGFDIFFREELELIAVDRNLNVHTFGKSF